MADAKDPHAERLLRRSLAASSAFFDSLQEEFDRRIGRLAKRGASPAELIAEAAKIIDEHTNDLVFILGDSATAAFLSGAGQVATRVKRRTTSQRPGGTPALASDFGRWDWKGMEVWLPLIEHAAQDLIDKRLLTRDEFDAATDEQRANAFTVAYLKSRKAIGQVRDGVTAAIADGMGTPAFIKKMSESLETSDLGPGHLETVFRMGVLGQYSNGMDKILANPIVGEQFPYEAVLCIHDNRLTTICATIAKSGLDGTNVYRRDDPTYQYFRFPRHYNDRCGRRIMSVQDAADRGITEAKRWIKTGLPPAVPAYVPWPIDPDTGDPLQLPPDFERRAA